MKTLEKTVKNTLGILKIIDTIEDKGISIDNYEEDEKICGYELNTYTDGGVNEIIFLDFRDEGENALDPKQFIEKFKTYINDFDIDERIDMYREDQNYKNNFSISESLIDFKDWKREMKELIKEICK